MAALSPLGVAALGGCCGGVLKFGGDLDVQAPVVLGN